MIFSHRLYTHGKLKPVESDKFSQLGMNKEEAEVSFPYPFVLGVFHFEELLIDEVFLK